MIEINLVPDVKQELLRAQRVRNMVISASVILSVVSIGIVALLVAWIFLVQGVRSYTLDRTIDTRSKSLAAIDDIDNTVTIQNQLVKLETMHDEKPVNSRVFDLLQTINPPAPNDVRVTSLKTDATEKTILIEAQATNGYAALEVFKKTLLATTIKVNEDGEERTIQLAKSINEMDNSFGEDTNGTKVLRFKLSFNYPDELLSSKVEGVTIQAPSKTNVTDSFLGVPQSLFVQKANDLEGEN